MYALTGFCPDIRRFFLMMSKHTRVTVAQSPSAALAQLQGGPPQGQKPLAKESSYDS